MEDMSKAMTNCFEVMNSMLQAQVQPHIYEQTYPTGLGVHGHFFHGKQRQMPGPVSYSNNTRNELQNNEHESNIGHLNRG